MRRILQVHDLLDPRGGKQSLKVREHNLLGPYVDGLSVLAVSGGQVSGNAIPTVSGRPVWLILVWCGCRRSGLCVRCGCRWSGLCAVWLPLVWFVCPV